MMRFLFFRIRTAVFLLSSGLFISSCTLPNTATRFYILDPAEPDTPYEVHMDKTLPLSVGIASLRLPQYLERPQVVTRSGENRLELAEFHQWGGNLRKNMSGVLAKNLSRLLNTPEIFIYPDIPQVPPDFILELTVMKFERDQDRKVRFSVQWRLSAGKDRKLLETQITEIESLKIQDISDMSETVKVMSRLIGDLILVITSEVLRHAAGITDQ